MLPVGSPLVRKQTISKQHTGPTHLYSYALKGIKVSHVPPIPIPEPVVLPPGWSMPQPPTIYNIDLSKERQVLEQAMIRRQAIAGEVTSPQSSLRLNGPLLQPSGIPLIPYQSSTILTPIPVTSNMGNANDSALNNVPLGEMSLKDFEGDSSDPFEATALQAIDVISELQSVLQPEAAPTNTISNSTSGSNLAHTVPQSPPLYPPIVSIAAGSSSSNIYESGQPDHNLLVDTTLSQPPIHQQEAGTPPIIPRKKPPGASPNMAPKPKPRTTVPSPKLPPKPSPKPVRNPPPPVSPPPTVSPNFSQRPLMGVAVLPPIGRRGSTGGAYPTYTNPSPPPPPPTIPPKPRYSLPDIRHTLTTAEKESLGNICGMGFPPTRVGRALKQFQGDDQKVFDFLLQVSEIEESGFNGDSGETALLAHGQDLEKSIEYLKQVQQYTEVWPEAKIHEAYQQSSGDWNKAIDILTEGNNFPN